jgi:hypothetical protein
MNGKLIAVIGALFVSLGLSAVSRAAFVIDFKPDTTPPANYALTWSGTHLAETPLGDATSNGDGVLAAQHGPGALLLGNGGGLTIGVPLVISYAGGLDQIGGVANTTTNTSTFYDVTLHLTGFADSGTADIGHTGVISQALGTGTFQLYTTIAGAPGQQLLLKGTVTDMVILGIQHQQTASVLSTVTFDTTTATGGILGHLLPGASGTLSWSLANLDTAGGFDVDGGTNILKAFDANMTGLFTSVPEPASLSILGLAALGLLRRYRR